MLVHCSIIWQALQSSEHTNATPVVTELTPWIIILLLCNTVLVGVSWHCRKVCVTLCHPQPLALPPPSVSTPCSLLPGLVLSFTSPNLPPSSPPPDALWLFLLSTSHFQPHPAVTWPLRPLRHHFSHQPCTTNQPFTPSLSDSFYSLFVAMCICLFEPPNCLPVSL